ncbi:hypothetical protein QZH41_018966, partial [Actinostola sp. cb2023]
ASSNEKNYERDLTKLLTSVQLGFYKSKEMFQVVVVAAVLCCPGIYNVG